jgi:hypothetical protein
MSVNINTILRADQRGWGPGWPNCQTSKWVPLEVLSLSGGTVRFPNHEVVDGRYVERIDLPGGVRPEIHDLVVILLRESERRGWINLHDGWCWGGACRPTKTSSGALTKIPSNHSWALAFDLNAPENSFGGSSHTIQAPMARLWNQYGFRWGGDYSGTKDWMHFEFMGTPQDAREMTAKARRELGGDDLNDEQEKTLQEAKAFLDELRGRLRPGTEKASPTGAGERVAAAVKWTEDQRQAP